MIRHYLLPISALIVAAFATSISAQQQPARPAATQPTPTPAAGTPATVALPNGRMAIISTDAFLDPKTGIAKFNSVVNKLNGEFQKLKDEINAMQTRAQTLETEINKLREAPEGTPIDQRALQAKIDQLEQLKKDIQRKAEDAQAAYNRRRTELFTVAGGNGQSSRGVCESPRHQRDHRRRTSAFAVRGRQHGHHSRIYY
jgi:outer membrane murein-binding lipoprotein Lpp